jgi:hypothetical protein
MRQSWWKIAVAKKLAARRAMSKFDAELGSMRTQGEQILFLSGKGWTSKQIQTKLTNRTGSMIPHQHILAVIRRVG